MANINYENYGFQFKSDPPLRTCTFGLWIVRYPHVMGGADYCVYIFHGVPAGQFWRDVLPLYTTDHEEKARSFCARVYGIVGSGDFALAINPDGSPLHP